MISAGNNNQSDTTGNTPASLRPGGPGIVQDPNIWEDADLRQPQGGSSHLDAPQTFAPSSSHGSETNPFLRKMAEEKTGSSTNTSAPSGAFDRLSLNEPSNNPWDTLPSTNTGSSVVIGHGLDGTKDPWAMDDPARQPAAVSLSSQPTLTAPANDGEDLLIWADEPTRPPKQPISTPSKIDDDKVDSEKNVWDDGLKRTPADTGKAPAVPEIRTEEPSEEWDMIFNDSSARDNSTPQDLLTSSTTPLRETTSGKSVAPSPEPTTSQTQAYVPPPRPPPRTTGREVTEMYHIKSINWYDHRASRNPRTSPILVQNANGPCPLVALVNALVLTHPPENEDTPIIQVLKSREQISISLLLDAVVDELISIPRQGSGELPDMTDLYNFLKGLDTGMNVNPRFIPSEDVAERIKATYLSHVPAYERDQCIPGVFEATKEMELYATFAIPLVHGWLPSSSELVYDSLKRRATSYEEAQHLLFLEEELNEKLENPNSSGLTPEEQVLYQDLLIIKTFLHGSATQLTPWGLEVLRKAMEPGMVAILFRNDHFSTLYKHPKTLGLLTLVTDAGYAGHQEVVWESLRNVNGDVEFYSGDFRIVSGAETGRGGQNVPGAFPGSTGEGDWPTPGASSDNQEGWTTVRGRGNGGRHDEPQRSLNLEQEDQDYAMALQLQEEEDERHRQEQEARRQQERRFSERVMEQQGRHRPEPFSNRSSLPAIPNRTSGLRRPSGATTTTTPSQQVVRPLVPPPGTPVGRPAVHRPGDASADDAPPSYDESANDTPFRPPVGHPSHPSSVPGGVSQQQESYAGPRRSSAAMVASSSSPRPLQPPIQRRPVPPSAIAGSSSGSTRDRDCVVM
ncbi:DUF455 domain-containing protein [Scedosporium apiospermum]|uniref:DUF455 domain-containing protein n=1 Tax=Pseudallescheria apiosperma TaxID=563466 RepID=A0A084GFG2_PSEDA|nr:DUF455 domain-containing protein [Scedosporium apiospermum]KEZ46074.1 DUF455 domain-containing protein [Scedosporium apiospermum]